MFAGISKFGSFNSKPQLGDIMHFVYDAKGKDHLPVWDRFPLCVPTDNAPGGFLGLNLHYAPLKYRHAIMQGLSKNADLKEPLKIRANYNLLKTMSLFPEMKPCIKRYLVNHVQSRFLIIFPESWHRVLNMPTEKWVVQRGGQKPDRGSGQEAAKNDVEAHMRELQNIKDWGREDRYK